MKLDPIFTSHAVFAAHKPVRVYGTGNGVAEVSFAGQTQKIVGRDGAWFAEFPPMEYGGPYQLTFTHGDERVGLDDIYVGEVYLFAGQSNMQFKLKESNTPQSAYESNDRLRLFNTDKLEAGEYYAAKDGWVKCEKDKAGEWTAIGYLVGREIAARKGVAVGVIGCYQGASVIESWVPRGTFEKIGIRIPVEQKFMDHTFEDYSAWNGDGVLYGYALSQVTPYAISGVVWYQGESDAMEEEGKVYAQELRELVRIWRADFKDAELPFVIVQIADFTPRACEGWRLIQQAQTEVGNTTPFVKTVESRDICETDDIHPRSKAALSARITAAILD